MYPTLILTTRMHALAHRRACSSFLLPFLRHRVNNDNDGCRTTVAVTTTAVRNTENVHIEPNYSLPLGRTLKETPNTLWRDRIFSEPRCCRARTWSIKDTDYISGISQPGLSSRYSSLRTRLYLLEAGFSFFLWAIGSKHMIVWGSY